MRDEKEHFRSSPHIADLKRLLKSIDRPGDYCARGKISASLPVLRVCGMDALCFPVPESQIKTLIECSRRSTFGRGPEALLDRDVRDSWEINPSELSFSGEGWNESFASILRAAADGLGWPRNGISARLCKLLVYEPGGFFLPHRDTEKTDGMIATLVVALPARGSGGEIVVRHRGRETVIDMRCGGPSEVAWAAFYSDCEHEIRPVLDGNRVVMVYSLALSGGEEKVPASGSGVVTKRVAAALSEWESECLDDDKIVWLLDHDYSVAGFSFDSLKNVDASVADILAEASEVAGYSLFAGLVTIEESDEVPCDEEYDCGCDAYVIEHMIAPDGTAANFRKLRFSREEALRDEALRYLFPIVKAVPDNVREDQPPHGMQVIDQPPSGMQIIDQPPSEDECTEDIPGLAGAAREHAYCLAAFVLWPKKNSLELIASYDIHEAFDYVETLIEGGYKYPAGWKSYAEGYVDGLIGHGAPDASALASRIRRIWPE